MDYNAFSFIERFEYTEQLIMRYSKYHTKKKLVFIFLAFIVSIFVSSPAKASYYTTIRLCNKGDIEIFVAYVRLIPGGFFTKDEVKAKGWLKYSPGECANLIGSGPNEPYWLAFSQRDSSGTDGIASYYPDEGFLYGNPYMKASKRQFCVKQSNFEYEDSWDNATNCPSNSSWELAPFSMRIGHDAFRNLSFTVNISATRNAPFTPFRPEASAQAPAPNPTPSQPKKTTIAEYDSLSEDEKDKIGLDTLVEQNLFKSVEERECRDFWLTTIFHTPPSFRPYGLNLFQEKIKNARETNNQSIYVENIVAEVVEEINKKCPIDPAFTSLVSKAKKQDAKAYIMVPPSGHSPLAYIDKLGIVVFQNVYVEYLEPNSFLAKAGVQKGDHIVSFKGKPIEDLGDLEGSFFALAFAKMLKTDISNTIPLALIRDGKEYNVSVIVPDFKEFSGNGIPGAKLMGDIVTVGYITNHLPKSNKDNKKPGSDMIHGINEKNIKSIGELRANLKKIKSQQDVKLKVWDSEGRFWKVVSLKTLNRSLNF